MITNKVPHAVHIQMSQLQIQRIRPKLTLPAKFGWNADDSDTVICATRDEKIRGRAET
jgi:hypothetical protein